MTYTTNSNVNTQTGGFRRSRKKLTCMRFDWNLSRIAADGSRWWNEQCTPVESGTGEDCHKRFDAALSVSNNVLFVEHVLFVLFLALYFIFLFCFSRFSAKSFLNLYTKANGTTPHLKHGYVISIIFAWSFRLEWVVFSLFTAAFCSQIEYLCK